MANYKIDDFTKGLSVYHKSNKNLLMVVVGSNLESEEITCRWIDKDGKSHKEEFLYQELIKAADKSRPIISPI